MDERKNLENVHLKPPQSITSFVPRTIDPGSLYATRGLSWLWIILGYKRNEMIILYKLDFR
jgi:hypothetical protein